VLLQRVRAYLAAGDSANALALMEVLADEDVAELSFASWREPEIWAEGEGWEEREDRDDEPTGFFVELGSLWAKALLIGALPRRSAWTGWPSWKDGERMLLIANTGLRLTLPSPRLGRAGTIQPFYASWTVSVLARWKML